MQYNSLYVKLKLNAVEVKLKFKLKCGYAAKSVTFFLKNVTTFGWRIPTGTVSRTWEKLWGDWKS